MVLKTASDDQHAIGLYNSLSALAQQVPTEGVFTRRYSGPKINAVPAAKHNVATAMPALIPIKIENPAFFAASQTLPLRYQLKSATKHPPYQITLEPVELSDT